MPPIAQEKYCPLYRIDYLVTKKSYSEKRSQRSIYNEIITLLDISRPTMWRIRRFQQGHPGGLSTVQLITLADYFNCTLDDLVVKNPPVASSPTQPGSSPVSSEEPGLISSPSDSSPYEAHIEDHM